MVDKELKTLSELRLYRTEEEVQMIQAGAGEYVERGIRYYLVPKPTERSVRAQGARCGWRPADVPMGRATCLSAPACLVAAQVAW